MVAKMIMIYGIVWQYYKEGDIWEKIIAISAVPFLVISIPIVLLFEFLSY